MNKVNTSEKDKYICYCSKVSYDDFKLAINNVDKNDFYSACSKANAAQNCAACLPNLEDTFYEATGNSIQKYSKLNIRDKTIPFYKKIINILDYLSGKLIVTQKGILPVIVSNKIETWLILSNTIPKILDINVSAINFNCDLYNQEGTRIKNFKFHVKPNEVLEVCINKYIEFLGEGLKIYTLDIQRKASDMGYRGSSRPHFFYKSKKSMASLHTQDGGLSHLTLGINYGNKLEKRWVFIHNTTNRDTHFEWNIFCTNIKNLDIIGNGSILLKSKGSNLFPIPSCNKEDGQVTLDIKSKVIFKSYLIISDSNFDNVSVDHL